MARPEKPITGTGPVADLARELRKLRREAGNPSYREMANRAHYSPSVLSQAASGYRLPRQRTVIAYAVACGGDPHEWHDRWEQAYLQLQHEPETTPSATADSDGNSHPEPIRLGHGTIDHAGPSVPFDTTTTSTSKPEPSISTSRQQSTATMRRPLAILFVLALPFLVLLLLQPLHPVLIEQAPSMNVQTAGAPPAHVEPPTEPEVKPDTYQDTAIWHPLPQVSAGQANETQPSTFSATRPAVILMRPDGTTCADTQTFELPIGSQSFQSSVFMDNSPADRLPKATTEILADEQLILTVTLTAPLAKTVVNVDVQGKQRLTLRTEITPTNPDQDNCTGSEVSQYWVDPAVTVADKRATTDSQAGQLSGMRPL